ncbi:hypothetical protein [Bradyrhizobium genosp. P]|uniref:hypothetical protein n=1 Tax=Bradyrhizobium genosp. P TaxID=83641 RepID=UPI003CF1A1A4
MGRVVFSPKAEPALDWSQIEARLLDLANSCAQSADLPIELSVTLANDPPAPDELPANTENTNHSAATNARSDPFDMPSLLTGIQSNQSRIFSNQSDCRAAP